LEESRFIDVTAASAYRTNNPVMMTLRFLFVVALALCLMTGTHGFMPTKKKSADRRSTFSIEKNGNNNNREEDAHASAASTQTQYQPTTSPTAAFSIPPTAMVAALNEYEEDEEDVSYEIALVSCIISLAIGFGTGYLV
jgi:hypothetical protein